MEIFDGRDIRVVARLFPEAATGIVITFTGRAANPPVEKGFGETYFLKRRISAVHFISKDNHWWQTPEPTAAIEELKNRGLLGGDRRITLYGSSMGGYAALILSRLITPRRMVLFSPQYSIDAARVPFEKRWRGYAARLKFDYDDMEAGIDHDCEVKVVYDPFFIPDRQHVALIEKLRPVDHVPIRFAGHNTARTLEELGLITQVIDELLFGDFSVPKFLRLYRPARPASSLFWHGLCQTLHRHGHHAGSALAAIVAARIMLTRGRMKDPVLRRDLLRSAIAAACRADMPALARSWLAELEKTETSSSRVAYARAMIAGAEGNWLACSKQIDKALGGKGNDPAQVALKIEAMGHVSGWSTALAYHKTASTDLKRSLPVLLAHARLLAGDQKWDVAIEVLNKYLRHDGLDPAARLLCARCWLQLGQPDTAMKQLSAILHYHLASDRIVDEVAALMEKGRGPRHAEKVRGRHKRFKRLFSAAMTALDDADWQNPGRTIEALRGLPTSRPERSPAARLNIGL
jgi:acetyl esterase/lipase